ncbi:MAG: hypothetical protein KatS3mg076_3090 [Candidatus Binatia bacterium]|nr:MAG: hypothetical protein KatS3mg076_3090 [Candidatus Binatia bacterium]
MPSSVPIVPVKDGLFREQPGGPVLLGGRCPSCRRLHFPSLPVCPYCSSDGCTEEAMGRRGRLYLHTAVVHRPPGYKGPVPYGFGVVELPEGIRVVTRLTEADPAKLEPGQPVELVLEPLHRDEEGRDVLCYAFAPTEGREAVLEPAEEFRPPLPPAARLSGGREVEIAGVGLHPFGRFPEKDVVRLGIEAVRQALAEAGIERGGFEAAYCGTVYSGVAAGHKVLTALGLTGVPIVNVEAGCASGGAALIFGYEAIRSGRYDCVLVFGMEKMPRGIIRSSFFEPWREEAGLAANPAYFALRARRLMLENGVTREHLARVSVKNHRNGVDNPYAMYRKEFSLEEVLSSPVVCDPLTLYMLCSPNEGAAAVVLRAARGENRGRVFVTAASLRSHLPGGVLGEHTPLSGLVGDPPGPTELAARDVYESAGIGPGELDVVELQDTDSARELLSYEELGLCPRGDCARFLEAGHTERGGRIPVNPSGGLLSKGEPLGASALGQIVELYWQLRGRAERRQVEGAKVALAHTVGRGANACVVLLRR